MQKSLRMWTEVAGLHSAPWNEYQLEAFEEFLDEDENVERAQD